MSSAINGFIILSLVITCIYFIGLITFLNDYEENKCEMTFMFEYPQFVKISHEIDEKYSKYGLYAYSEGRLTEKARDMYFDGIPVLFIPGNAGSHKQARSLASVALRKALNSHTKFHFDYYAIDLNNELSGLNGALLTEQLEYANSSVYRILELYKERKNQPKSVILYAHSVGGVIARRLIQMLPEKSDLIPIVVTLATPHKRSPLMLDSYTFQFYQTLNSSKESDTTFVSLTGGYSDFLVPPFLASAPNKNTLNIASTHIPRSWVGADHVCVMWCKQMILALNRALFDCVDAKTKQISTDANFRKSIFQHHLIHHNGLSPFLQNSYEGSSANIKNQGEWLEPFGRQFTLEVPRYTPSTRFYMIRLLDQPLHEMLTVVAVNLETVEWVFVCGAHIPKGNERICQEFTHLSHYSAISPSHFNKRRSLDINLHSLLKTYPLYTHVIFRALPSDDDVTFHVDVYRGSDRNITVTLPGFWSFKRQTIIKETNEGAIRYNLIISNLSHVIQSYQLHVDEIECKKGMPHATATLTVPWTAQDQHKHFVFDDKGPFHVRLYESRPQWASSEAAVIKLTLDPNCRYTVSINKWFPGVISQMARHYSPFLIVNIAAVILMTLNSQLRSMDSEKQCSLFFNAIKDGAKPYYILTGVKLISRFLSFKGFLTLFPVPDWLIMTQDGIDFYLLPMLLYLCSVGIVWLLGIFLCIGLVVCETTIHKITLKFLTKTVRLNVNWSDYIMSALHKIPCVVALILVSFCFSTTGSLALCVGAVFYFLRLTQLSQDYIEELVWYYTKKITAKFRKNPPPETKDEPTTNENTSTRDAMFFHITLFLLWCILTVINVPSVLTWAHNYKYSSQLRPDPAFVPGLILSLCALPLWQLELPKIEKKWYNQLGYAIFFLASVSLIYAPISIYRLNYTLTSVFVLVTLHQLVAPSRDLSVESSRTEPTWYDALKAKLE